jgi:hypothetical protein
MDATLLCVLLQRQEKDDIVGKYVAPSAADQPPGNTSPDGTRIRVCSGG